MSVEYQLKRKYRDILPSTALAPSSNQHGHSHVAAAHVPAIVPRTTARSACDHCHNKKLKCDAKRPSCHRCAVAQLPCKYRAAEGETIRAAVMREHSSLQEEVQQLKQLLYLMRERPYPEALQIFSQLRIRDDPLALLEDIKHAELLLPRDPQEQLTDTALHKLDEEALRQSRLKVPAHPWTMIAGDGTVSSLISNFFDVDHNYLTPFLHASTFIREMRTKSTKEATYCTPTLVNAICALKCLTSPIARRMRFIIGQNMAEKFLNEAKKLLELENGRTTIPSVNALCLMYLTSALLGRDRAGSMYRYSAYNMARRLRLDRRFATLSEDHPETSLQRHIISRTLWGHFCFESRMSYFYSEASLIQPPTIPILFDEEHEHDEHYPELPPKSPYRTTSGAFSALCELSKLFYRVMVHNTAPSTVIGSIEDLSNRAELYSELKNMIRSFPSTLKAEENFTAQTSFKQTYIGETVFSILQVLNSDHFLGDEPLNVRDLCITYCEADSKVIERHMKELRLDPLLGRGLFVCLSVLVPYLDDPAIHPLFIRNCFMLRACLEMTSLVRLLLKGVQATAWGLKKTIPKMAQPYFEGLDMEDLAEDLPVTFSLPHRDDIRKLLAQDANSDPTDIGVSLSTLVSKWSSLTL